MNGSIDVSEKIKELPSKIPSHVERFDKSNNDKMMMKIDNNNRFKPPENKNAEVAEEKRSNSPKRKINPKKFKNLHRHFPKNGEYYWTILNADSYRNQVMFSNISRK